MPPYFILNIGKSYMWVLKTRISEVRQPEILTAIPPLAGDLVQLFKPQFLNQLNTDETIYTQKVHWGLEIIHAEHFTDSRYKIVIIISTCVNS